MYEYLKGTIVNYTDNYAVVDVLSVGYRVLIPINYARRLQNLSGEQTLYTSLVVRETAHLLYGFLTLAERDTFLILIEISGIGPKVALAIIGTLSIRDLIEIIQNEDSLAMSRIPGIGKKTAERIIVDLKSKLSKLPSNNIGEGVHSLGKSPIVYDALRALMNLGYTRVAAEGAIQRVQKEDPDIELAPLITAALQKV